MSPSAQLFLLVFVCVVILIGTYYLSKYLQRARFSGKGKGNLYIAEVIGVGMNATVQLIRAGEKYILIGVTKDRIVYLTDVPSEEIDKDEDIQNTAPGPFDKYLQKFMNKTAPENPDDTSSESDGNEK